MRRLVATLTVLAGTVAPSAPVKAASTIIGLSLPTQREVRWVKDRRAMELEARRARLDLRVQVADNDAALQLAQCERLIADGVEVLILAPHDAAAAAAIIAKADDAGVPVISYDRLVTGSPHAYHYVSFDAARIGELQGEFLARKAPKGDYVVLSGPPSDHNAKLFAEGAMKHLKPLADRGDIRIVANASVQDWQAADAQRICAKALAANGGKLDAVLAPNDGTAGGCLRALAAADLAGRVVVTGQDAEAVAASRILRGTQSMTVFKDTRELARKAIEIAVALSHGRDVETGGRVVFNGRRNVDAVLLPAVVVTRENLDAVLIRSGFLRRQDLNGER
jgi:D-xylose transport system substrate-binding protein